MTLRFEPKREGNTKSYDYGKSIEFTLEGEQATAWRWGKAQRIKEIRRFLRELRKKRRGE